MKLFFRELVKAFLVGIAIFIVFLIIFFIKGWDLTYRELWVEFWENMVFSVIIYMFNAASFIFMMRKYDKELFTKKYVGYGILGNIVASILGIIVSRFVLVVVVYQKTISQFLAEERTEFYVSSFVIAMAVAIMFYAAYYYKYYKEKSHSKYG